jgi:PAS domain S-box-containing protein
MKDENKSKRQLIQELAALRQEVASLKASSPDSSMGRPSSPHEEAAAAGHDPSPTLTAELPADFRGTTRHRLTEAMFREGEAGFRMLAETVPAIIVVHRNGRLLYVNPLTETVTGYTRDELLTMNFGDLLHPDFRQMTVERGLARQQGEQPPSGYEVKILTKGGEERWLYTSAHPIEFRGEAAVLGTAHDITRRKWAEKEQEQLLAAQQAQHLRAETLAEVILALNSQVSIEAVLDEILRQVQRLVPFNAANIALLEDDALHTVRSHGYEVFGSGEAISHLVHPLAVLPLALEAIRSLKPIGVPDTRQEPLWTREKDFAWIRSHIMMPICLRDRALGVLRLDSDRPGQYGPEDAERLQPLVNAIAIALENARLYDEARQELAERTRAEEELRQSEKRYRSVVDNIQDGFYRSDKEGRLIMASPSNARMLGYLSVEEMLGLPLDAFWENPGERTIGLSSMREQGTVNDREAIFVRKDGSTMPVSISAHFYYDEAGALLGTEGIIRDITERKRAEAERERLLAAEREQRLQVETLAEVVLSLTSHIHIEDVLDEILRQAQRVVPFTTASISLMEGDSFHVVRGYGYEAFGCEDLVATFERPLTFFPLDAEAIQARKALIVFDTRSEPRWVSVPGVDWIRSFLMVPICLHERVLGILGFDSDVPGRFTVEDAQRLQPLANAAAVALENARLYDQAQREIAERARVEVERERLLEAEHEQHLRAETLAEVVLALTSQVGIEAVLDEILRQAQRLVPSDAANIALLEGDALHTARWQGYETFGKADAISNLIQPLTAFPLAIKAIRSQKPLAVQDTHAEPLWTREEDFAWIRSHIVMPICLRDHLLGVLRLDSDTPGQFCIEDAERLQPLVNAAAVALESARLYDQVRQELAERTWAERELRQSEARHRALLHAIPDMILRLTHDGTVVDLKPPADHASPGLQLASTMDDEAHKVVPAEVADWIVDCVRRTLDAGTMQRAEFQFPTSQGVRDYEIRFVVSGADEVCTIVRDVTDRKQAEQRVIQAQQMAMLGWLAAALAHEINNPLQIIQSHLDLVLDFPLEKAEGEECLRVIRQTISRLSDTTRSVVDFARPETGLVQPVDVDDVLREVMILTGKRLQQTHIQVAIDRQPVPPVLASPGQLAQVFLNLVLNAIEAMVDGGRLRIHVYPEGDQIAVAFTNSGPPIPPEILSHLFEPFITTKPEGTGLGLWVSNTMVRQQGGVLSIQNLKNEGGVTCTVKLPASPSPAPEKVK